MLFPTPESYVSDEALRNLRFYKYSSIDMSPVSKYILKPYWEFCTTLFPMWLAPNLITLLGFFFVLANVGIALIYTPDLSSAGPSWIYFSFAAGMWLYSTFDNVDGKQARRTGSSSPLGELFDHGVDSLNCSFGAIVQAAGLGMGLGWRCMIMQLMAITTFYFSTWENYHTGSLYLGYINGPTEGLIIACGLLVASGIWGPGIWWQEIGTSAPILTWFAPSDWPLGEVCLAGMLAMMLFTQLPVSVWRVAQVCKEKNTSTSKAMGQLVPYTAFVLAMCLWFNSAFSTINGTHTVAFVIATGLVFGRIATAIILAHVTHSSYPTFWKLMIPVFIGAGLTNLPYLLNSTAILPPALEIAYLYLFLAYAATSYLHWATAVIDRFCSHLGIQCLRIAYRPIMARP
ncbi:CDP-alcohol phosphatidyltransferase-domain-containing protein [Fimicolochytrium jonesii]|uniref:CDP-alcohol phosphatidyltransferase-domain-containing protein n=1 Tax=Fimicolochytrium jonesii TaxID=1396493 RepID=UPI0022FDD150|nr:CDP-alcohol phosphatidyltransferase-domain-containing protein [Fimicolochytrium jonesii]KAI8818330.1 CDP-alcohol phosphatidyltransferase-domain-containing protein [Fimicolochytrium jonesii]